MKPPVLYGTGDAIVLSVESDSDEEDKGGRDTLAPSPLLLPIDEHSGSESDLESDSMDTDVDKDPAVHSPRDDDEENEEAPRGGSLFELLGSVDDVIDALEEPRYCLSPFDLTEGFARPRRIGTNQLGSPEVLNGFRIGLLVLSHERRTACMPAA